MKCWTPGRAGYSGKALKYSKELTEQKKSKSDGQRNKHPELTELGDSGKGRIPSWNCGQR